MMVSVGCQERRKDSTKCRRAPMENITMTAVPSLSEDPSAVSAQTNQRIHDKYTKEI